MRVKCFGPAWVKSQYYWSHRIEQPVLSETSVRYSIVFKSMRRNNKNSTIIIGDSNTHEIYFNHEEGATSVRKYLEGE